MSDERIPELQNYVQSNSQRISKIEDNIDYAKFEIQEQRISELEKKGERDYDNIDANRDQINANLEGIEDCWKEINELKGRIVDISQLSARVDLVLGLQIQLNELKEWNKQLYEDYNACYMNATRKNTEVLREFKDKMLEYIFKTFISPSIWKREVEKIFEKLDGKDSGGEKEEDIGMGFVVCPKCDHKWYLYRSDLK